MYLRKVELESATLCRKVLPLFYSWFCPRAGRLARQLSAADKALLQAARARYYNLELKGFVSATCQVHFDFSTVPALSTKDGEPDRKVLEGAVFTLHLNSRQQPALEIAYPSATTPAARDAVAQTANLLKSLVTGFFQTWPSKGLDGPVPPFDSEIQSVSKTDKGYSLSLLVPGAPVRMDMDKNYLVTEISSAGGKIEERPAYAASPDGLVFAREQGN